MGEGAGVSLSWIYQTTDRTYAYCLLCKHELTRGDMKEQMRASLLFPNRVLSCGYCLTTENAALKQRVEELEGKK